MPPVSSARFQAAMADRYVIDRVLGQGGMGTVYLARDVKHGRPVAIKVLFPEVLERVGAANFLREIRLTARLQHPHILPLLDSGEAAGCSYYVMPYVKDGSLRQLMNRKGRLSLKEGMRLARGLLDALHHAHENRVVHFDIKPENILISGGHAVLTDFGISRAVRTEDSPWRAALDTSSGTPAYVSPEQASGEPVVDPRSDIYSLACVLFEMFAGAPPFDGASDLAVVSRRFTQPAPSLSRVAPHVPAGLSAAIRRAMAIDVNRRFSSVRHFRRAVDRGVGLGARPIMGLFTLGLARLFGSANSVRRSSIRRSRSTAQSLISKSRHSIETAAMAAKASSGANWTVGEGR
jgi:serine/threonine-protein kinase